MNLSLERIIIILSTLFGVIIFAIAYGNYAHPMLKVMVGFSAQTVCHQHLIAKKPLEFIYQHEMSPWSATPVEMKGQKVVASIPFVPFYSQSATFIPNVGCVLGWQDPATVKAPSLEDLSYDEYDEALKQPKNYAFAKNYKAIAPQKLPRRIRKDVQKIAEEYVAKEELYTRGFMVARKGVIVAEAYGNGGSPTSIHQGWSMTKSLTHALYGIAIKEGLIDLDKEPVLEMWSGSGDPRRKISFDELFRMKSGLVFDEAYFPPSDATEMIFTRTAMGRYAAEEILEALRTKRWHYSSGTTAILSWILADKLIKQGKDPITYMRNKLFRPMGMSSMLVSPDFVGTPAGSSHGYATTEDWLKLGLLYAQKGVWRGRQLVPANWVAQAKSVTEGSEGKYSHHWWVNDPKRDPKSGFEPKYPSVPADAYWAGGFNGQVVMVIPSRDVVIARLGWTLSEKPKLDAVIAQLLKALPK